MNLTPIFQSSVHRRKILFTTVISFEFKLSCASHRCAGGHMFFSVSISVKFMRKCLQYFLHSFEFKFKLVCISQMCRLAGSQTDLLLFLIVCCITHVTIVNAKEEGSTKMGANIGNSSRIQVQLYSPPVILSNVFHHEASRRHLLMATTMPSKEVSRCAEESR